MASLDSAYGLTTGRLTIGATMCNGISAGPFCNGYIVQYLSGGTVTLVGLSTMTAGYLLSTTPIAIGGNTPIFFNESAGVTSVVQFIKTLSPNP